MKAPRDEIGNALIALKKKGYPIVAIDSDLASSTRTDQFQAVYPDAFFEMGIAEGSAMSFATGQALEGNIPFYVNFAMFVTGTAWTQLRQACYAKANIKLVGSHPGMDDGPDGASHHALEDLALTRVLPGLTILTPADAEEVESAFEQAVNIPGPVYIRVAREPMPVRDKSAVPRVTDIAVVFTKPRRVTSAASTASGILVFIVAHSAAHNKQNTNIRCIVFYITLISIYELVETEFAKRQRKILTFIRSQYYPYGSSRYCPTSNGHKKSALRRFFSRER